MAFAFLYFRRQYTINPDAVYRHAMVRLNTSPGVLEVCETLYCALWLDHMVQTRSCAVSQAGQVGHHSAQPCTAATCVLSQLCSQLLSHLGLAALPVCLLLGCKGKPAADSLPPADHGGPPGGVTGAGNSAGRRRPAAQGAAAAVALPPAVHALPPEGH